jgi:hypothetical protein
MYSNKLYKKCHKRRDRSLNILMYLHFSDNTMCIIGNRLNKIRDMIEEILYTFKSAVKPGKGVVMNKSTILWRGRLRLRQYIKRKRYKYGIKL